MILALLLAACPNAQTQVFGTATDNGNLTIWPKTGAEAKTVTLTKDQKWTVCLDPTLPWVHSITDLHFNPWYDVVDFTIAGKVQRLMWAIPKQATADSTKIETDGKTAP